MKAVAITDKGLVRLNNEDTVYCSTKKIGKLPNLFVVADGMGGANAGEYASQFVIKEMVSFIKKCRKDQQHLAIVQDAIDDANEKLYKESRRNTKHKGCGTTVVAAIIEDGMLYVSNVGDSRLYVIGKKDIRQITRDHSYVEEMVSQGRMVRGSRDYLAKKNIITRAIGTFEKVEIDTFDLNINDDEKVLLCTDGLSNMLDDRVILDIVAGSSDGSEAANRLVEAANEQGGVDNISVVLITELGKELKNA